MKIMCDKCRAKDGPCVVDVHGLETGAWPQYCLWDSDEADWKKKEDESMMSKSAKSCETCGRRDEDCSNCEGCWEYSLWTPKTPTMSCYSSSTPEHDTQYRESSIVSKHKEKIEEIVNSHWNYVAKVIDSGADTSRQFSFSEVMEIRKWDYTSAARHFYGHGYEDGVSETAEKALKRIKEA